MQGATVTLTNEGTNVSFTTTTTSAGTYVFDSVQVGTYTITVEREGFKKFVSAGNVLTIGQPMTVNVSMQVGQVTQSIKVEATAELVQTSTGGNIGNVVSEETIQQLLGIAHGTSPSTGLTSTKTARRDPISHRRGRTQSPFRNSACSPATLRLTTDGTAAGN
jgi:hypothetical protein